MLCSAGLFQKLNATAEFVLPNRNVGLIGRRGLKVIVVTQRIDLNGAVGRMIAAVMLGLAEIELEFRAERQAVVVLCRRVCKVGTDRMPEGRENRPFDRDRPID